MSRQKVIRAWKDPEYRSKLSNAERELLPEHPAGVINLSDTDLEAAAGGQASTYNTWTSLGYRCILRQQTAWSYC